MLIVFLLMSQAYQHLTVFYFRHFMFVFRKPLYHCHKCSVCQVKCAFPPSCLSERGYFCVLYGLCVAQKTGQVQLVEETLVFSFRGHYLSKRLWKHSADKKIKNINNNFLFGRNSWQIHPFMLLCIVPIEVILSFAATSRELRLSLLKKQNVRFYLTIQLVHGHGVWLWLICTTSKPWVLVGVIYI